MAELVTGLMSVEILAISTAMPGIDLPGIAVSNDLLSEVVSQCTATLDFSDALPDPNFALERVGIKERRFLDHRYNSYDLGLVAARKAVSSAGVPPSAFTVVVVSSVTPPWTVPSLAALIQAELGLGSDVVAFDTTLGCSGYLGGLHLVDSLLRRCAKGSAGLLVTTEIMSRVLDARDRQTSVIFGDGAAATVLRLNGNEGLSAVAWSTQGEKGPLITIAPSPETVYRFHVAGDQMTLEPDNENSLRVQMNGRQVFKDMVRDLPQRIELELQRRSRTLQDFAFFAFHQANSRIIDAVIKKLGIPAELVLSNILMLGNTTSASIPIMLAEAYSNGTLRRGQRILLVGFGTGYSVGISELLWTLP